MNHQNAKLEKANTSAQSAGMSIKRNTGAKGQRKGIGSKAEILHRPNGGRCITQNITRDPMLEREKLPKCEYILRQPKTSQNSLLGARPEPPFNLGLSQKRIAKFASLLNLKNITPIIQGHFLSFGFASPATEEFIKNRNKFDL